MSDTAKLILPQPNTGHTTDTGRVREKNEDSYWVSSPTLDQQVVAEKGWLFIVADGMGGYQGGEVASAIVVKAASESYYANLGKGDAEVITEALHQAVLDSQKAVLDHQSEDSEHSQMGSTLVMAVVRGAELYIANLGDSRCYRLRDGTLEQLSHDHSWVAEQVRTGLLSPEQVHGNVNRSLLTRALGQANAIVRPEIEKLDWRTGDRLLLCSDGLWDMVPDDNIRILLSKTDPQEASAALVDAANAAGGADNITAVVVGGIASQDTLPMAVAPALERVTGVLPTIPAAPTGLPRIAVVAIVALVVIVLAALIVVSQMSTPAQVIPTNKVVPTSLASQLPTAVVTQSLATVEESTATVIAIVASKATVTSVASTPSPSIASTQSVSEAIAASTVVATETPALTPVATTTPLPMLVAKACITHTVTLSDWQKSTVATGVQAVGGGIAVWGSSHIATRQDFVVYLGLDQLHAPFTVTVKALTSVKPAPTDLWACFQNDVNSAQCTNTMKGARSLTQLEAPGLIWAFVYPFVEQPALPQLRLISLAKQKTPLTIMEIEFCQG